MKLLYQFFSHAAWVCIVVALGGVVTVALISAHLMAKAGG